MKNLLALTLLIFASCSRSSPVAPSPPDPATSQTIGALNAGYTVSDFDKVTLTAHVQNAAGYPLDGVTVTFTSNSGIPTPAQAQTDTFGDTSAVVIGPSVQTFKVNVAAGVDFQTPMTVYVPLIETLDVTLLWQQVSADGEVQFGISESYLGDVTADWEFGDGTPHSPNPSPLHRYAPGHYTVTVRVAASDGRTKTVTAQVTVV